MFANAYELTSQFTFPVINSLRFYDGIVDCGLGSFIILNNEGWILTAAHIIESVLKAQKDQEEIKNFVLEKEKIEKNPSLLDQQKKKLIKKIENTSINKKWITNHSLWWGSNEFLIDNIIFNLEIDLAVGQIKNFDPQKVVLFPKFKNPASLKHGTSLCKLGFPFHNISAKFDPVQNKFNIPQNVFPIPRFPLEGIFTRVIDYGKTKDSKFNIKYIETSTPGLRGQSGGPIFDIYGNIWAIQSKTIHLPLGFEPTVKKNGKDITEIQFLNIGLGVHLDTILAFLNDHRVKHTINTAENKIDI